MTNPTNAPQGANASALSAIPALAGSPAPCAAIIKAFEYGRMAATKSWFDHSNDDRLEADTALLVGRFQADIARAGLPMSADDAGALAGLLAEIIHESLTSAAIAALVRTITDLLGRMAGEGAEHPSASPKPTHGDAVRAFDSDHGRLLDAFMYSDAQEGDALYEAVEAAVAVLARRFRKALAAAGPVVSPEDVPVLMELQNRLLGWDKDFPGTRDGVDAGMLRAIDECLGAEALG